MRYYIYLDKHLIQNIFATFNVPDFDIEIMEFSVQEGVNTENDFSISPSVDNMHEEYKESKSDSKLRMDSRKRNNEYLNLNSMQKQSFNKTVQRRYINIDDVSEIKNITFYDKLIRKLEMDYCNLNNLYFERGIIFPCKYNSDKYDFFLINDKYIWIDKERLESDIKLLNVFGCKVNVAGMCINNCSLSNVIKPLAIYIE